MSAHASPPASSSSRGRWLLAARASWIAAAVFAATLCIAGIVVTNMAYPKLCGNPNQAASYADVIPYTAYCVNLGPVNVTDVHGTGLSLRSYTTYTLVLDVVSHAGLLGRRGGALLEEV
jgi:hypothetical protein